MKRLAWLAAGVPLLVAMVALTSCDGTDDDVSNITVMLQPLAGCMDVEASIRQAALAEMNRQLDEQLQSLRESGYGGRCYYERDAMDAPSAAGAGNTTQSPAPDDKASEWSETNNQVAGVDEADFVKTDGKHMYVASGGSFRVIEAWPATTAKEVAKVAIEGEPRKLFVFGDRALVYSSLQASTQSGQEMGLPDRYYRRQECTYGYGCQFTGDGQPTKLTVFDISDRAAPKLVREVKLSGSLLAARRVEKAVHSVFIFPGVQFPDLRYWPEGLDQCADLDPLTVEIAFAQLRAANTKLINSASITDWLPSVVDTVHQNGQQIVKPQLLTDCQGFYRSGMNDGRQFTSVLSLDITQETDPSVATIVSPPGAVYASAGALYMSVPRQRTGSRGWYPGYEQVAETSTVHKFGLITDPPAVGYAASGIVKGHVLNQFAMDEHEGHLRIATSNGRVPSPDVHSTMTVLAQQGETLVQTGIVDGLAPKEDIRSVRFAGDRGYVVTFKKTDPLFVFDLSNPAAPKVQAELKIPGFSTYMHMMDEGHLLTIGYDADDQGSFAWFTGVMLQIFDVTVPTDPKLMHKEIIGTRGSSSEALTNHLAFTYFPPKNVLALPMTICEGSGGGGSYGNTMTFSGLMVYDTTVAQGFNLRGKVPHLNIDGEAPSCSNWWTNASSKVKRSIIMEDFVFSISDELIKVNHLNDLSTDLVVLPIGA